MPAIRRMFNRAFFVVLALTVLLLLAAIVVLPGQGSTYTELAQARSEPADAQPDVIVHNTWSSGAPMPAATTYPGAVGVLGGLIYVVGGYTTMISNGVQVYNPVANTWSTGVPLPTPLMGGAAATVKNILYVIGGTPDGPTYSNAVWAFNPVTKTWSSKSPMPTARDSIAVVVENNIIYVIGGNGSQLRLNTVESYNPATDTWTEETPLRVGVSDLSAGTLGNKLIGFTIVSTDGYSSDGDTGDTEGYNATGNSWSTLASDPNPRNAACAGGKGAKLIVAGGYPGGGPGTPAYTLTESYLLKTNKWKTLAAMPQGVISPGSAFYKGRLYCFGGSATFVGTPLNNVQIYQP